MSDSRIVFFARLTFGPPGSLVFHNASRRAWDRTECGRSISHKVERYEPGFVWIPDMTPCRRDTADVIGRPCSICRWRDW